MRDEWKCVLMTHGELCMIMDGHILMVEWYVDNWVIAQKVKLITAFIV